MLLRGGLLSNDGKLQKQQPVSGIAVIAKLIIIIITHQVFRKSSMPPTTGTKTKQMQRKNKKQQLPYFGIAMPHPPFK